jgi:capsid protein
MPPRKTSPRKKKETTAAKPEAVPTPSASFGGWQSVGATRLRRAVYNGPAQDLRRDMKPSDRLTMVKRCRWAERNSGLFKQILNDLVLYTVGDGIKPQSHAADPALADRYEEYFAEKSRRIDITNRFSYAQAQQILMRAMARDGDSFAAKVRNANGDPKLQLVEAHRVGDPMDVPAPEGMHDGCIFGAYGELIAYNVYRSDGSNRQILAQSMMHIVDQEYASGARGIPLLQHSINSIQDEMDILELEKLAVKDNADVTRVIKKAGGFIDSDMASELGAGSSYENIAARMGGKLIALEPGEDFQSFTSNRPSPTFTGFLAALERDISQGVLPYEFVNDPSKIGGASVRLITAKAGRVFGKYQSILIEQLCQPTWGYIIGQAIAAGELPDDPNWASVSWTTPKSVTVDAGRDASNDRADVEMGLLSMSELYAQRGLDFRTEMKKRASDMVHIQNLSAEYGIPFELLFRPSNTPLGTVYNVEKAEAEEGPEMEDEPADQEEPESEDQPNS